MKWIILHINGWFPHSRFLKNIWDICPKTDFLAFVSLRYTKARSRVTWLRSQGWCLHRMISTPYHTVTRTSASTTSRTGAPLQQTSRLCLYSGSGGSQGRNLVCKTITFIHHRSPSWHAALSAPSPTKRLLYLNLWLYFHIIVIHTWGCKVGSANLLFPGYFCIQRNHRAEFSN